MKNYMQEREVVRLALYRYSERAKEIMDRLAEKREIVPIEKLRLRALYTELKDDFRDAASRGTVASGWEAQSLLEKEYFQPAMMDALKLMRARANTNPMTSNWLECLDQSRKKLLVYIEELESASM